MPKTEHWDDRHFCVLNDARYGSAPWQVFRIIVSMITRYLSGGENAQTVACLNMKHGTFDASHATLPFGIFLEGVDGKEAFLEVGDMRKDEVGHDFEIGANLGDGAQEHHAFDATKRMVADHDKAAFLWDVLQLFGSNVDGDVHVFQQVVGKLTALVVGGAVKQAVDLTQTKRTISHSRHTSAKEAFQS